MVTTAVIMAAGLGTRFGDMTTEIPKGFINAGDKPMIIRSVETLLASGIKRIIIGTGFKKELYQNLAQKYPGIECVYSPAYATTNSMYTLWNCRHAIGEDDFLVLESDLVFEKKAIDEMLADHHSNSMLCADVTKFQDSYYLEYNQDQELVNCSVDENDLNVCGEMVGIHKLSNSFYKELCSYYSKIVEVKPKMGYEFALLHLAQTFEPIHVYKIPGLVWYEIDDYDDLKYAEKNIIGKLNPE
jgi:2-aminoethylphosphonate-pyruvate transaminase